MIVNDIGIYNNTKTYRTDDNTITTAASPPKIWDRLPIANRYSTRTKHTWHITNMLNLGTLKSVVSNPPNKTIDIIHNNTTNNLSLIEHIPFVYHLYNIEHCNRMAE